MRRGLLSRSLRLSLRCFVSTGSDQVPIEIPSEHELIDELKIHAQNRTPKAELDRFVQQFQHRIPEFQSTSIAQILYSCKTAEYANSTLLESVLKTAQLRNGVSFNSAEISMILSSLPSLHRLSDPVSSPLLLTQMQELCLELIESLLQAEVLHECPEKTLSILIYSLGVLFKNQDPRPEVLSCMEALSDELCQDHRLEELSQQTLTSVIYAFSCIGWKQDSILSLLSREIINRAHGFTEKEISSILFSLGNLSFFQEELIITLGIEAAEPRRASRFKEQEICNVLHGITLSSWSNPALLRKLRPALKGLYFETGSFNRIFKYNLQDLASLLNDFAKLSGGDYFSQKPWIQKLMTKLIDRSVFLMSSKSPVFSSHAIEVFYACARMQYPHEGLIECIIEALEQNRIPLSKLKTVSLLLWGLTRLERLTGKSFILLCGRIMELRDQGVTLKSRNWVQITQAAKFIQQSEEKVEISPKLKYLLEEALNES